jgi:hypothetical protein
MATSVLKSGIASGELRSDIDVDAAIDALYGALYYRFLIPSFSIIILKKPPR